MITYRSDVRPDVRTIAELYRAALLNRPVDDLDRIRRMYDGSNLILTAWEGSRLAGILRGWTDEARDGYVCDLAVYPDYQRRRIGATLLELVREGRPEVDWILRASTIATDYYQHIGWKKIENGWSWPREK
ncbi:MAG: GNAT family N-acetyltransferase [Acidobacteria bacterium]|nr:MAG: GNAT family N-acetyltransferase [Acidobacteriota bacterium]PYX63948.1 MAG: GNAT family N-acetyltransferase [Acidobacteriota bacterium]